LSEIDVLGELRGSLPVRYFGWSPLNQAAYLEMTTFFSPYVLASQGDRMAMAHGVEARLPFLDHHLFDFAAALPTGSRLRGLNDKQILRRWASRILAPTMKERNKKPYHLDVSPFFGHGAPDWAGDLVGGEAIRRVGIFSPTKVASLTSSFRGSAEAGFLENQTLAGVLSTQLWHHQFIDSHPRATPLPVGRASVVLTETAPAYF
jgi:asparagine synthase (glutamine-hydrolysing)